MTLYLVRVGLNDCQIARVTGIPRGTIRDWRHQAWAGLAPPGHRSNHSSVRSDQAYPRCGSASLPKREYAYLLGLYLGDGCLSEHARRVFALRVACASAYPGLMEECVTTIKSVRPGGKVFKVRRIGCVEVLSLWKHWPCLFPQHGPGRKHERKIELTSWQAEIVARHPEQLLRGLIHSDGWRGINPVARGYPRYLFSNVSDDIRGIFCRACDVYGVRWRQSRWNTISVARRESVTRLDAVIGPKK